MTLLRFPVPRPRASYPEPGRFHAPPGAAVHCSPGAQRAGRIVARATGLPLRLAGHEPRIVVAPEPEAGRLHPPRRPDGFAVRVAPDRIELAAAGLRALGYAATVLAERGLGCGRVVDFADLAVRAVHLDLKGPMPAPAYLTGLLAELSRCRVNAVLVEYEDKFPYSAGLGLAGAQALTREQLRELLDAAREHDIDVIPLVQCLGHNEHVLAHERHRALAEDDRHADLCPALPGSLELVGARLAELIAAHPDARLVHIGGDEPWSLGRCPRCRAYAAEHGKARLWADYVARVARIVAEAGRTPVVWDDVLHGQRDLSVVDLLPAGTVLMQWEYWEHTEHTGHIRWGAPPSMVAPAALRDDPEALPGFPANGVLHDLESLPEHEQDVLRAVKYDHGSRSLAWLRGLTALGVPVLGAAAARGADGEDVCAPRWHRRIGNITQWARQARAAGALGVVTTAWSAYSAVTAPCEPLATAEPGFAASGLLYWNADLGESELDAALDGMPRLLRLLDSAEPHHWAAARRAFTAREGGTLWALLAEHADIEARTAEAARAAAFHIHAAEAKSPALAWARAEVAGRCSALVAEWLAWREAFARELRTHYVPAAADHVAAVKAAEPLHRLRALLDAL
ncbi:family 20 glycosylhydrolase [Thermoactinospora rubra]|uniref:family 20 glycosylhydrolase n=1 Tax=Thermoactinospora rubra TaxID=1088767 RepID=UPI000A10D309|nr:family 20 glycosylhydrolase [Thermoactinospora rubra]